VVLRELALLTRGVVRAEDIVVRYGGEEFCILLPELPLSDAEQVADRLRAIIAAQILPPEAGVRHVTVSVGMASLHPDDGEGELFTRADLAMYAVKRAGGNQVCVAEGDTLRFLRESA
jgi:diguanylate cyclase (GGDEF)-like protein